MDNPIWHSSTVEQKTILITLLMMANHETKEWEWCGKKYKANPGEFVTSAASIIKNAGKGITRQNVRTALERFKKYGFLTYETTKTGMLITIENWGIYQAIETKTNQVINQEVTNNQPTGNQEVTTNKNDKNILLLSEPKKKVSDKHFDEESREMKSVKHMLQRIKEMRPTFKEPNLQSWCKSFDRIYRIDKRDPTETCYLINEIYKDEFWRMNILSPDKLRKQYDRLWFQFDMEKKLKG